MALRCVHCRISGRVQGVGFRYSTAQEANRLGLVGWVRNLADGRVETQASGLADDIGAFLSWLERGPRLAMVLEVETREQAPADHQGFTIR